MTARRFDVLDPLATQVWDGVSNRCINTYKSAHGGEIVSSVRFSKNSKYILSSGRDGVSALWELSTGKYTVDDVIHIVRFTAALILRTTFEPVQAIKASETIIQSSCRVQPHGGLWYGPVMVGVACFHGNSHFTVLMSEDRGGLEAVLCWEARTARPLNPLMTGD